MVVPCDTGALVVRSLVRVPGSGWCKSAGSTCCDLSRVSGLAASVPVSSTLPAGLTTSATTLQQQQKQQQPAAGNTDFMKLAGNFAVTSPVIAAPSILATTATTSATATATNSATVTATTSATVTATTSATVTATTSATVTPARVSCKRPLPQENTQSDTSPQPAHPASSKKLRTDYTTLQTSAAPAGITVPVSFPNSKPLLPQQPQQGLQNSTAPPATAPAATPTVMTLASVSQLLREREHLRHENQTLQLQVSLFQQLFRNKEKLTSVVRRLGLTVA